MLKVLFISFVVLLFIISCNSSSVEQQLYLDTTRLETFNKIDTFYIQELFDPVSINVVDKYIVMTSLLKPNTNSIFVYSKDNIEYIDSFLPFGKGHNEIFDLNPNYFYSNGNTFYINSNMFYEKEIQIINDSAMTVRDRTITNQITTNLYKLNKDSFILLNIENEYEYTIQTGDSIVNYNRRDFSTYPKLHNIDLDMTDNYVLYEKSIVPSNNSFVSFYYFIPVVRKYDSNFELETEYIISYYSNYKIENVYEILENGSSFFKSPKYFNNMIAVIFQDKELLLFDNNLNLIKKYALNTHVDLYTFDDEYLYILNKQNDPYCLYKIKI